MGATFLQSDGERTGRANAARDANARRDTNAENAEVGLAARASQNGTAQRVAAYQSLLNAAPSVIALQRKQDTANGRALQRKPEDEEPAAMQQKAAPVQREGMMDEEKDKVAQSKAMTAGGSSTIQREGAPAPRNDTGLSHQLKAGVESLSGVSMDDVKVHYNSDKPAVVQALAYTQGSEIHVAPGQEQHVPHEAWHVAQQKQGRVAATTQMKGVALNDDPGLEHEADVMGARAASVSG